MSSQSGIQQEKVNISSPLGIQQEKVNISSPPGIQQEKVSIEDGSQDDKHACTKSSSAQVQHQCVMPSSAINLAVTDEDVGEPAVGPGFAEGPKVVNPGGQKRKAETEATYSEVAEVSQEILDLGDGLCEAFQSWKAGLVEPSSTSSQDKPDPGEEPEDDAETPELTDKPPEKAVKETPELTEGFDEAEAERDPAQEVQAVRKKEATKEMVFFGYPRNSRFSLDQLARSARETERWLQEADEDVKQEWLKGVEEDKVKFHDQLCEFGVDEQEHGQWCNLWKLMDWHQENQEPTGYEEDETEGDVTTQVAEHAEDYANEEHEAFQEQSDVLHEDHDNHASYDEEPAGYSEHHEDHAGGDVQNVLSDDWQQEEQHEDHGECYTYAEQHEDHECHAQVEQQEGQDSYGDSHFGSSQPDHGYHDEEEGYGYGQGYEAEDPCYDYYETNEAW